MARRKQPAISDQLLDQLLAGADPKTAFAKDGLLDELKKALAERALNAEIDHHLDKGEEDGRVNSRNGYGRKSVLTETSKIELEVPRDRLSTFDPQLIAKYQRRFPGFDDKIVSMYARGMSVREIQGHLRDLYGVDVSADLVSAVTDAILDEIAEWQNRPLEALYALVFFDAIRIKVRDEGMVRNKAAPPAKRRRQDGRKINLRSARRLCSPQHHAVSHRKTRLLGCPGEVGDPQDIRPWGPELPVHLVERTGRGAVARCGFHRLAAPLRPILHIRRATVQRATSSPSRFTCRQTLRTP